MPQPSTSAGGVVVNQAGQVLVTNQDNLSWSLPKGHIDPGEDELTAAIREVREETGVSQLEYVARLGEYDRYRIGKGGIGDDTTTPKHLIFLLFTTRQTALAPEDARHPEALWLDPEAVSVQLTHPKDREFYESVLPRVKRFISHHIT